MFDKIIKIAWLILAIVTVCLSTTIWNKSIESTRLENWTSCSQWASGKNVILGILPYKSCMDFYQEFNVNKE